MVESPYINRRLSVRLKMPIVHKLRKKASSSSLYSTHNNTLKVETQEPNEQALREMRLLQEMSALREMRAIQQLQSQNYELARAHSLQGKRHQALEAAFRQMAEMCAEQTKRIAHEKQQNAALVEQLDLQSLVISTQMDIISEASSQKQRENSTQLLQDTLRSFAEADAAFGEHNKVEA